MTQNSLDLQKIKQVIENKSGYPFELDIVRRIETDEKYVYLVEPYYSFQDQDTGEARELDFHAIQATPVSRERSEYIFNTILGSCKDNKNPYVFITREMPLQGITLGLEMPIDGFPLEIYIGDEEKEDIDSYFNFYEIFHTIKTENISGQFCEVVKQSGNWCMGSKNISKDVIIPLIKALSREIETDNEEKRYNEEFITNYEIFFPLLVLNGPLIEYHMTPEGLTEIKKVKHIVVVRHYESEKVKGRFAIDVIHESFLKDYLELIDQEVGKFINLIRRHRRIIVSTMKRNIEEKKKEIELKNN